MKDPAFAHPFTQHIVQLGFSVRPYRLTEGLGAPIGLQLSTADAEIVFNYPEADTLRIVLYRRIRSREGIANAFRDLVWLIFEASNPRFRLSGVAGLVHPEEGGDSDTLSGPRIVTFYTRYLAAQPIETTPWGVEVYGRIADFLARWKRARPAIPRLAN